MFIKLQKYIIIEKSQQNVLKNSLHPTLLSMMWIFSILHREFTIYKIMEMLNIN